MVSRQETRGASRKRFLKAATTCFGRQGYYRTTMDDIAAESGLSKGALYWHFRSKKELFISLFQVMIGGIEQAWNAIADSPGLSATDKIRASIDLMRTEMGRFGPLLGVMLEAWALTRQDADVGDIMRNLYAPYLRTVERMLAQGVAEGEFQTVDARATSLVILTLLDGIVLAMSVGLWDGDWGGILDAAERLVVRGLRGDGDGC